MPRPYIIKTRKHHNNKGYRSIQGGKTYEQVRRIASKLGVPFGVR